MNKLSRLFDQNKAWAASIVKNDPNIFKTLSKQQSPEYLWIGCADSRVPANQIVNLHRASGHPQLIVELNDGVWAIVDMKSKPLVGNAQGFHRGFQLMYAHGRLHDADDFSGLIAPRDEGNGMPDASAALRMA